MNDEINKLIREKGHWERRIVELGGPDYSKVGPKVTDSEGRSLVEGTGRGPGYRYFGAAKQLPGVRELFEKEGPRQVGWQPLLLRFRLRNARAARLFVFGSQACQLAVLQRSVHLVTLAICGAWFL